MFFDRRRWALRVTERMGLAGGSGETQLLTELLIWSAKEDEKLMLAAIGKSLPKPEGILIGAISMVNNTSAVEVVAGRLKILPQDAERLLLHMRKAALELAQENGFESVIKSSSRR